MTALSKGTRIIDYVSLGLLTKGSPLSQVKGVLIPQGQPDGSAACGLLDSGTRWIEELKENACELPPEGVLEADSRSLGPGA